MNKSEWILLISAPHRAAAGAECIAEDLVGNDVQLLLVLSLDVGLTSEPRQVADTGAVHQAGDLLAGGGNGGDDGRQLNVDAALHLLLHPQMVRIHVFLSSSVGLSLVNRGNETVAGH